MAEAKKPPRHHAAAPHLDTQTSYRLGVPLIYVRGELDHDSASGLREVIDEELSPGVSALVLDFSELSYMDSGGLSLMFDIARRLSGSGWLGVVSANQAVSRLLEITGLIGRDGFRVFPDLAAVSDALAQE
jgi:anti-anti-sigma factor